MLDVTMAALHRLIPHEISPMAVLTYKCSHLQVEKLTHKSQEESGLLGACDEWGFAVGSPDVGCSTSFKPGSLTLHGLERYSFSGSPKWVFPGGGIRGWFQDSGPSCGLAPSSGAMPSSVCIQWMKEGTQRHRQGRRAIGQAVTGTALHPHPLPGLHMATSTCKGD